MVWRWIESSLLAESIRQSTWLYPFIEIIHILGIVLVAGGAILFDIRLLSNKKPVKETTYLVSWSKRGLILAIPSGILLFATNAETLSRDPVFGLKLVLLFFAIVNAWIFHIRVNQPAKWIAARYHAIISILLWISIISCGRLLAY